MTFDNPMPTLVLASTSPRRKELLSCLGLPFVLYSPAVDETPEPTENIREYTLRMGMLKAGCGFRSWQGSATVIGADTVGEIDNELLLKPASEAEACEMLGRLSGREHWVHTSLAVQSRDITFQKLISTRVKFRMLSSAEVLAYCRTGEGLDKAGSYAIQGRAAAFVESIEGSYSAVVGLPLSELSEVLQSLGYRCWKE